MGLASEKLHFLEANGGSNISGAITEALERVRLLNEAEEPGKKSASTIIFLSGGFSVEETQHSVILETIRKANAMDTPIYSLAQNEDNFELIEKISMQNHGSAHNVHNRRTNDDTTNFMADFLKAFYVFKKPVLRRLRFTYETEKPTFRSLIDRKLGTMYQGSEHCNVGVVDDTETRIFHADVSAEPNYQGRTSVNLVSQLLYLLSQFNVQFAFKGGLIRISH